KRSILITRCSLGGVGHALALEFAANGIRVFATARSTRSLFQLEEKGIETFPLDVTSADSIAALKQEVVQRTGGKLDILFNSAGTMYEAPAVEADPTHIRGMFDANVLGLFDMVSTFTPLLLASVSDSRVPPTIINTSSILARLPFPFGASYNASKAAVASYSDTLRIEVAPLGIKVVTLFMREVSTGPMSADNISFGSECLYSDIEGEVKRRSVNHTKTSMKPEEFARQVVQEVLVKKSGPGSGEFVWKGTNAFLVWFLGAVGWRKVFDGSMEGAVGLEKKENRGLIFAKRQNILRKAV
ncbi:NAD(P)-binding protein, partial [Zopfia rhizophila CBS 207.26]